MTDKDEIDLVKIRAQQNEVSIMLGFLKQQMDKLFAAEQYILNNNNL